MGSIYALKSMWYILSTKGEHVCIESCKIPHKVGQQNYQQTRQQKDGSYKHVKLRFIRLRLSGLILQMTSSDC